MDLAALLERDPSKSGEQRHAAVLVGPRQFQTPITPITACAPALMSASTFLEPSVIHNGTLGSASCGRTRRVNVDGTVRPARD